MTEKVRMKILTAALTILLAPFIAAYCLLWAVMTIGGGIVKHVMNKISA